jgi:DNA-binding XRE family transcriptional regulator
VITRWDTHQFQRIASVEHTGDTLVVRFADGSEVFVDPERVLPANVQGVNWDALQAGDYKITVPSQDGQVEIPWSTIRALTDREYASHLAVAAEEEARLLGRRIREFRESRGLTSKEVAERAGIAPQSLYRIEHGHHDVVFTTLRRILAAMGCSLKDLVRKG